MPFYDEGRERRAGSRSGVRNVARGDPREPALHLPARAPAGRPRRRVHVSRRRLRSRVAAVVLPLGHAAGSGAADAGGAEQAVGARGRSRSRRGACSPIPRADALGTRFAGAVAAAAGHRQGPPGSELLPELRRQPRRRDAARDGAVLQQPGARGPQRARSLSRRLHVRERAARAALRHSRASPATQFRRVTYPTTRGAACSARAACWCRPRSPTARRRCCAASG